MATFNSLAGVCLLALAGLAGAADTSVTGVADPIAPAEAAQPAEQADPAGMAEPPERLVSARAHAGEPVKSVRFLRPAHRIEVLDDSHVLVWQSVSRAWLVELRNGKGCRFLDHGIHLGLKASYHTLNTSDGEVLTKNGVRCRMTEIREVDVPAMRAAEDAANAPAEAG